MSLSYTADECREIYKAARYKRKTFGILLDMNPSCTRREMAQTLGIDTPRQMKERKNYRLRSPFDDARIVKAINACKYQTLAASIIRQYGTFRNFCDIIQIDPATLRKILRGTNFSKSSLYFVLYYAGMTLDEAQKEWNPCMEKDTAKT